MLKSWFCIYRLNSLQILQIKSYSFLIYPKFCVPTSEMPKWTFLLKYRFGYKKAQKIQKFFDFRKVHNLTFLWIYTLLGVFPASKDLRPFVCSSLVQCWPMSGFFIYIYIYIRNDFSDMSETCLTVCQPYIYIYIYMMQTSIAD